MQSSATHTAMNLNYTLSHLVALAGNDRSKSALVGADRTFAQVVTDSRSHIPNPSAALFVALVGTNHDGHRYIPELYRRGVRSFLVGQVPPRAEETLPEASFVQTGNPLAALQALAADHRSRFRGTVVAVTGSNGKTVVKEWIAQLWPPEAGKILRSPMSYNSQLGVALSLLMIEGDERWAVIEAGISKPGEMERLEAMIRPQIGLITNIGEAHSENFGSMRQKLEEKLRLFARAETIVYPDDADFCSADRLIDTVVKELYGGSGKRLCGYRDSLNSIVSGTAEFPFRSDPAAIRNAALVDTLYRAAGLEHRPFAELQPVAMRLELREGILGSTVIDDSYNSDLTSLGLALDYLDRTSGGRPKVLILSDILQAGREKRELYAEVARRVREHSVAEFVGIGPEIAAAAELFRDRAGIEPDRLRFHASTEDFLRRIDKERFAGCTVLVKGSRTFGFERISRRLEKRTHTTTLEVNLNALSANLARFRALLKPGTRVMAMVKAFSYGTGSAEIAAMLQFEGVDYLAVAFADEGVALREAGIRLPIVVLNSDPGSFAVMADNRLEPEIYSFASLRSYAAEARSRGMTGAPIHLKMDTGMHRLGFVPEEIEELCEALRREESVRVRSIFSHLAASEDPAEDEFTRSQIARFEEMSSRIVASLGDGSILRHLCNSAGIARFPEAHFDMVRLGVGLYGIEHPEWPAAATLKTQIVQIKELEAGETVGYNRRGIVTAPMRTATIPIGYADGMDRRLSRGVGKVSIHGVLCPTVGNICMDTCMIDISALPAAAVGDEVTVFGERPTVREVAEAIGTISYEILTSISARIKRVYVRE